MKKLLFYIISIILLGFTILFSGCKRNDSRVYKIMAGGSDFYHNYLYCVYVNDFKSITDSCGKYKIGDTLK